MNDQPRERMNCQMMTTQWRLKSLTVDWNARHATLSDDQGLWLILGWPSERCDSRLPRRKAER